MKRILFFLFVLFCFNCALSGQDGRSVDSLRALLNQPAHDTLRLTRLGALLEMVGPNEEGQRYNTEMGVLAQKVMSDPDTAVARKGRIAYASFLGNSGYIAEINGDIPAALAFYNEALSILQNDENHEALASVLSNIAYVYNGLGDIPKAIEYNQQALAIRETSHDRNGIATTLNNLATIYRDQGETDKALIYFERFRDTSIAINDSGGIALALNNIGNLYLMLNDTVKARTFLTQGLAIARKTGEARAIAQSLFGLGNIYFNGGNYAAALPYFEESLRFQEQDNYRRGIANVKLRLAQTYAESGDLDQALKTALEAHAIALKIGYVDLIQNSAGTLKDLYRKTKQFELALEMHELEVKMRDSLVNEKNRKIIIRNEMEYEYNKKLDAAKASAELEVQKNTLIRNFALGGLAIVLIFLVFVVIQRNRISKERKRSDDLLLNILPSAVAEELKQNGYAKTQAFEQTTILFTDFKDFTRISEILSPAELVAELDYCFKEFDRIVERYHVEKIKTTGDAYMAAGGIPLLSSSHAVDTVKAAMDICAFMTGLKKKRDAEGKITFEVRVGVHTGPVVAGIVGVKKFAYDIWGDSVNMASRMESSGQPGKVNISETTYELVKDQVSCTYRGKVQAKNKGEIAMYFADELKS